MTAVFLLYVTYPTGYVHVASFATAADRALHMISLAHEPVVLRVADY